MYTNMHTCTYLDINQITYTHPTSRNSPDPNCPRRQRSELSRAPPPTSLTSAGMGTSRAGPRTFCASAELATHYIVDSYLNVEKTPALFGKLSWLLISTLKSKSAICCKLSWLFISTLKYKSATCCKLSCVCYFNVETQLRIDYTILYYTILYYTILYTILYYTMSYYTIT